LKNSTRYKEKIRGKEKKNIMDISELIIQLRLCVGYLGERDNFGWWRSSFFIKESNIFLSPLFSRTQLLAQCNGVTHAATLIHDERIGIGNVYHLFRLPEEIERRIHNSLKEPEWNQIILTILANTDTALDSLQKIRGPIEEKIPTDTGPIRVGNINEIYNKDTWKYVAGFYLFGFTHKFLICPYFSDIHE